MDAVDLIAESDDRIRYAVDNIRACELCDEEKGHLLEWLVFMRINRNLSVSTVHNYGQAMLDFALHLKSREVPLILAEPKDADEWHKKMALSKIKIETRSMRLSGMRGFYRWADYKELCITRMHTVVGPKRDTKLPKIYSDKQLREFFTSVDRKKDIGVRDYAVLMFFLGTGARRCEVEKLQLSEIELSAKVGAVLLDGKGGKERMVGFEQPVVDALRAWILIRDKYSCDHEYLFCALNGRTKSQALGRSGLDEVIGRVAKCSGSVSEGLHRLRAVFATQLYEETRDIELVRVTLGHNDINTTRRYIAISPSARRSRMTSATLRKLTGTDTNEQTIPSWLKS